MRTSSTVCHFLFFVLDAFLSLQTKENCFRASDIQQHFIWSDFAENAKEKKGKKIWTGYLIFMCGQYILFFSHRLKFTYMHSNKLLEHKYLFRSRIYSVNCWASDINPSIENPLFPDPAFAAPKKKKLDCSWNRYQMGVFDLMTAKTYNNCQCSNRSLTMLNFLLERWN